MKIQKNPIIGVILGIGFMALGILQIAYPKLDGAMTSRDSSFANLIGALLFTVGLVQVLYIGYKRRGDVKFFRKKIFAFSARAVWYTR